MASPPDKGKFEGSPAGDVCAVIVAAGAGVRMNSKIPKPYLPLAGRPLLCHSIDAFCACPGVDRLVIVVAGEEIERCKRSVLPSIRCDKPLELVKGGVQRSDSVFRGLEAAGRPTGIAVIHDGVRPLVRPEQIHRVISAAREDGAAILAIPASDTLKSVDAEYRVQKTIDRSRIWMVQTPQAFRFPQLWDAHQQAGRGDVSATDDALLLERRGLPVTVVRGDAFNLKITTARDLQLAEALLSLPDEEPSAR